MRLTGLILVILVIISFANCIGSRRPLSSVTPAIQIFGPPCREGLVSVEPQAEIPLRLTNSKAACDSPQEAQVQFVAENTGKVKISKFEVRAIGGYDRPVSSRKGVNSIHGVLEPQQTITGIVGAGTFADQNTTMTSCKLAVWSITYADGTTWKRAPNSKA